MLFETLFDLTGSHGLKGIYLGTTPIFIAAHIFDEKNDFEKTAKETLATAFSIMRINTKSYK